MEAFRNAHTNNRDDIETLILLAISCVNEQRKDEAIVSLIAWIKLNPDFSGINCLEKAEFNQ